MTQQTSAPVTTQWQTVGRLDDFTVGAFVIVDIRGREVGVYRSPDGRWFAAHNLCPHRGAPLCTGRVGGTVMPSEPGELIFGMEGEVIRCPWHSLEFSLLTGESLFGASTASISVHEVIVEGDEVRVSVRPRERKRMPAPAS